MNHLKLIGGVLLVFLLIGPIFPMPLMMFLQGDYSEILGGFLIYPFAVLVGSVYAVQSAIIFLLLIVLTRKIRSRYEKLSTISINRLTAIASSIAGIILLIAYGRMPILSGMTFFFLPSVLCGLIYGRLFRQFLTQYLDNAEDEVSLSEVAS